MSINGIPVFHYLPKIPHHKRFMGGEKAVKRSKNANTLLILALFSPEINHYMAKLRLY
jgi:hypothetical protein